MRKVVKNILGCAVAGGCLVGISGYVFYADSASKVLDDLKVHDVQIEWGSEYPTQLEYYVDKDSLNLNYADVSDFKVSCDGKSSENGYLDVGAYNLTLTCGEEKVILPLEVVDTSKPVFKTMKDSFKVVEGSDINYKQFYSAVDQVGSDELPVNVEIINQGINLDVPGEYQLVVTATDSHDLSETLDVPVNVISKEEAYKKGYTLDSVEGVSASEIYSSYFNEQEKAKEEKEIREAIESGDTSSISISDYATPPSTAPTGGGDEVSGGNSISVSEMGAFVYPSSIYGDGLSDIEYAMASEVYSYVVNGYSGDIELTYPDISSWDSFDRVGSAIANTLGISADSVWSRLAFVDESGMVNGSEPEKNTIAKVTFKPDYIRSQAENNHGYQSLANQAVINAGLYSGMSESEAVRVIADYICSIMSYSYNGGNADTGFTTGSGNCHTYAQMFSAMCEDVGISSSYQVGYANGANGWGRHAWNTVNIGGSQYYIDVCWMDTGGGESYYLSSSLWDNHIVG